MGFVLDTVHRLFFEEFTDDDTGECLEIRARALTMQQWLRLVGGGMTREEELQLFEEHLVSWNLQNRGEDGDLVDVPATPEGVRAQDAAFILRLMGSWGAQLGSVNGPLGRKSTGGSPSVEESIPMEPLSTSPEPSLTPS